jgi:hypothetical protein
LMRPSLQILQFTALTMFPAQKPWRFRYGKSTADLPELIHYSQYWVSARLARVQRSALGWPAV